MNKCNYMNNVRYLTEYIQRLAFHCIINRQIIEMFYIIFFHTYVFKGIHFTLVSTSQFILATFQASGNHMWLQATVRDVIALEHPKARQIGEILDFRGFQIDF